MNRKKLYGLLAITIVVATIGSVAAMGGSVPWMDFQGRANIANAIKANDFSAWQAAMTAQLTQANFDKLVKNYQTMSQKRANMSQWRTNMSKPQGTMFFGQALNPEMIQALKDGNYTEWTTAAANSQSSLVAKITNPDQFNILVQIYKAKLNGNYTQVKELSNQLGLPLPGANGNNKMYGHFGGRRGH
jgi:hypothetical protein